MDDLQQEFILETRETLALMTAELIAWEAEPDHGVRLDTIFRFFHTVKGSAGFLTLPRFEALAHEAENILALLRENKTPISSALVTAILALIDRIAALTDALESGVAFANDDDEELIANLKRAWDDIDDVATAPSVTGDEVDISSTEKTSGDETETAQQPVARTIRVSLKLLDHMMNGVSDMVLARNEVARHIRDNGNDPALDLAFERLSSSIADLRESVGQTRMQKLEGVFAPLPRIVRDVGQDLGKDVGIHCQGSEVELDREMIEMIRDPLVHIIRNAIDHGIELPAERALAGKRKQGSISINARQSGNHIIISVRDDGKGIAVDKLVKKAVEAKVCTAAQAAAMSENQQLNLVFSAGLSTSDGVSAISGRGVGMDVVRSNIERIGGAIDLKNTPGSGLEIIIRVPLTLTIISSLIFGCDGQQFAIPQSAIREITMVSVETVRVDHLGDKNFVVIRDQHLPVVDLAKLLNMEKGPAGGEEPVLMVIDSGTGFHYVLSVDEVMGQEDLVVRAGAPAIMASGVYAGTTLPDHGRPLLLIDPNGVATNAGVSTLNNVRSNEMPLDAQHHEAVVKNDLAVLVFKDRQDRLRALPLAAVERVEDFAAAQVEFSAGRFRLTLNDKTAPLFGMEKAPADGMLKSIALHDGNMQVYFAIDDIVDMHNIDREKGIQKIANAADDSPISGLFVYQGQQVELIDPHWLFSKFVDESDTNLNRQKPVCLLESSDDNWTRLMLAPLIANAGYDVRYTLENGETADICIASSQANDRPEQSGQVIHLRENPNGSANDSSIYRYDRIGLLGALQAHAIQRRAGEVK